MTHYIVALALGAFAAPQHGDHGEKGQEAAKGEVRVYFADKDKKPADLKEITATILIEYADGPRKTLKAELVTPKGDKKTGLGHGGDVVDVDGWHVELAVVRSHGGEKEHGEHADEDGTPYLKAEVGLSLYSCGMSGHPAADKAGKCSKCPMEMKARDAQFSAVVIFKVKGETKNAKGFQYPPAMPATYGAAIAKLEEHLKTIDGLIKAGDLDKVHATAEKISRICEKLAPLGPKDDQAEIAAVCKEIVGLFKEIDAAADAGKKDETVKVYQKYVEKVAALKKHAKEHGGH